MVKLLLGLPAVCCVALMVAGCGDLASLDGADAGYFNNQSSSFTLAAGDTIDVAYSVSKADDEKRRCAISIAINGVGNTTSDEVVTSTDGETSLVSMTVRVAGDYVISVAGKNMVYSVSVTKE